MRYVAVVLLAVALALALVSCGGDDEAEEQQPPPAAATTEGETETAETVGEASGEQIFQQNCAGCHTLDAAGTTGTVGPNLDELAPSADEVEEQVREGGGGMPSFEGRLTDEEIAAVAEFVAGAAGG